ncbi:hypothetical protein PTKIN_Ptkin04bG0001600 [Pterospermum kingtungense]
MDVTLIARNTKGKGIDLNEFPHDEDFDLNDEILKEIKVVSSYCENQPFMGREENTKSIKLEYEPFVSQCFPSEEEAYVFYKNYVQKHGFAIRRERTDKKAEESIKRDFVCHRYEKPPLKIVDLSKKQRDRESLKCDCKAHLYISLRKSFDIFSIEWEVTAFGVDHNHQLLSPSQTRFLPTNRVINDDDRQRILLLKEVGLSIRQIEPVMELEKNVKHVHLSFLKRDIINLFCKMQKQYIENDAMELLKYCKIAKEKDSKFQYAFTVDKERKLEHIFWCPIPCFDCYKKYEDVVVFDTTYKVNACEMPFGIFVGVNNHGKTILFGCALLRNETTNAFQWLMKVDIAIEDIEQNQAYDTMLDTCRSSFLRTLSPLEEQTRNVLTPYSFKLFQEVFGKATQYSILIQHGGEFLMQNYRESTIQKHMVYWDGKLATCTCRQFEFSGILC